MTIVFDLDYTLYDTAAMKEDLLRSIVALGPSEEAVTATFTDACRTTANGVRYYVPDLHAALLHGVCPTVPEAAFSSAIAAVPADGARFLYAGAADLLMLLRGAGHRLILMTLGDDRFQRAKALGAGLDAWFAEVRTTVEDKELLVEGYAHIGSDLAVVNDNVHETMRMRDACPSAYYVIKEGPKGIPEDCDLPVARTLEEVGHLLNA